MTSLIQLILMYQKEVSLNSGVTPACNFQDLLMAALLYYIPFYISGLISIKINQVLSIFVDFWNYWRVTHGLVQFFRKKRPSGNLNIHNFLWTAYSENDQNYLPFLFNTYISVGLCPFQAHGVSSLSVGVAWLPCAAYIG